MLRSNQLSYIRKFGSGFPDPVILPSILLDFIGKNCKDMETKGIEPLTSRCKRDVFPLALSPRLSVATRQLSTALLRLGESATRPSHQG
jgi:hypothetical protein